MTEDPDLFRANTEQPAQKAEPKDGKLSAETVNLKVPAKVLGVPDEAALAQQRFPATTVEDSSAREYPIKPLGSLSAPSKSMPDTRTGETISSAVPASKSGDAIAAQNKPKPKLTNLEIDKAIADLGSTKHETVSAAKLKLGEAIAAANGADAIKALGKALENIDPQISNAAARLLSDTFVGSPPRNPFGASYLKSSSLRYSDADLPSNKDERSHLFAYLSNSQNLDGEFRKIAELKQLIGDESKFTKIKANTGVAWPNNPNSDTLSGRTEKMNAIFQLNKTKDLLVSMRANTADEFLAKNLHLLKDQSSLDLKTFPVTQNSLREIAKQMPNLEALYIPNGEALTDSALMTLQGLKQLRTLHIDNSAISDQGLAALGRTRQIHHLFLGHTPGLTNQGIANLIGSDLASIGISDNPQITREVIPSLQRLANESGWLNINLHNTGIPMGEMRTADFDFTRTRITVSNGTADGYCNQLKMID